MNILTHIHAFPPMHNAGAEWMLLSILRYLVGKGHECTVLTECNEPYMIDGITVMRDSFNNNVAHYKGADVVITHLGRAGKAWNLCTDFRKPLVHICHNDFTNRLLEVKNDMYMVYNTEWMRKSLQSQGYNHPSMVLHPPIWKDDYITDRTEAEYITLINCNDRKGGQMLIDLARRMPDRKFLGVIGQYGDQLIDNTLPNLTYHAHTSQIRDIYARTRIVIMPSVYESYGRVAVEAACAGIPVICNDTEGLTEALGELGLYAGLDIEKYIEKILLLDEKKYYNELSLSLTRHGEELDKRNYVELDKFDEFLKGVVKLYAYKQTLAQ